MASQYLTNPITLPQSNVTVSSQQSFLTLPTVSNAEKANGNVQVELENAEIWNKFHQFETEMIITKPGRRMFPTLRYTVHGLEMDATYAVYLHLRPVDDFRYKYNNGKWSINGRLDVGQEQEFCRNRVYMHPDSPATGRLWMKQPISFHKIKLTNNNSNSANGLILLHSMHKYRPIIYVVRMHNIVPSMSQVVGCGSFQETEFMAVTAYQNDKITQLKIDHNPFAKGFREHGKHEEKRRYPSSNDGNETVEEIEEEISNANVKRFKLSDSVTVDSYESNVSSEISQTDASHVSPISTTVNETSMGNSSNASTPLATVWSPITTNWTMNPYVGYQLDRHFQLPQPLPACPPLNDWVLQRPYPLMPLNSFAAPPMWNLNFLY